MKKILSILAVTFTMVTPAFSWEVYQEKGEDGSILWIADQFGDGGAVLSLVCLDKEIQIEVIFPIKLPSEVGTSFIFQVDGNSERLVAGDIEKVDSNTSVFIGLDRRGLPAASTKKLVAQMKRGRSLYLGDPDIGEAVEQWSMSGATKAINAIQKKCQ